MSEHRHGGVGLEDGYFRLAVRGPEDNRALIRAFHRLTGEA